MKTPFYLSVRSLVQFEAALRDVSQEELSAVLDKVSSKESADCNPHKQQLVEAELARRKTADVLGGFTAIFSLLSGVGVVLLS